MWCFPLLPINWVTFHQPRKSNSQSLQSLSPDLPLGQVGGDYTSLILLPPSTVLLLSCRAYIGSHHLQKYWRFLTNRHCNTQVLLYNCQLFNDFMILWSNTYSNSRAESLVLSSQLGTLGDQEEIPDDLFREYPVTLNFSFPTVCQCRTGSFEPSTTPSSM